MRPEAQSFADELAKRCGISVDQACSVLDVLAIDKLLDNYNAAKDLVQEERKLRAVGVTKGASRMLPDFTFENLGLVLHDSSAAIPDLSR